MNSSASLGCGSECKANPTLRYLVIYENREREDAAHPSAGSTWVTTFGHTHTHTHLQHPSSAHKPHADLGCSLKNALWTQRSHAAPHWSRSDFVLEGNCHAHASTRRGTKGLPLCWRAPRNADGKDWVLPAKSGNRWAISNIQELTVKELGEVLCLRPKLLCKMGQHIRNCENLLSGSAAQNMACPFLLQHSILVACQQKTK